MFVVLAGDDTVGLNVLDNAWLVVSVFQALTDRVKLLGGYFEVAE